MFSKATLLLAFTALTSLATASSPPGCLLGAVNTYSDPAEISAVCKSKDATTKIAKYCGAATEDALSAFADICNDAGVKVSTAVPSATGTGSIKPSSTGFTNGTASGGAQATGTGAANPSGSGAGNPTGTQTGGPVESTGAAGKFEVSAALLAGLGLMAAAL